jgi:hypothetical protein
MDDRSLASALLLAVRKTAALLLDKHGSVVPFGATIDATGEDIKSVFPMDQHPRAGWEKLLELVLADLAVRAEDEKVSALAFATTLESESELAFAVQIETRAAAALILYPYQKAGKSWKIGDGQSQEDLLIDPIFD